ncbi:hypothetical protein [Maribacter sp. 2304DJ31-5]|uniref:hypothetical protein n=1 Tax=Maribacter sp. 2304DJ31-5 TaxID=3386273 RepID=UPI0039BC8EFB
MVSFFVVLLISIWGYKLIKILLNSKELTAFAREFDKLSKKYKFSEAQKSDRYKIEARHYRLLNKKTTISSLIWFFIEVVCIVLIYLGFAQKYFSSNLF